MRTVHRIAIYYASERSERYPFANNRESLNKNITFTFKRIHILVTYLPFQPSGRLVRPS